MIIGYLAIALVGALSSLASMWPQEAFEAALAAPIGGSLSVMLAAVWALYRVSARIPSRHSERSVAAHFTPVWTATANA